MDKTDNNNSKSSELKLRKILAEVMKEKDLSVGELARLAGTSKSVVYNWTAGSTPHDLFAVRRLSKALNIPFYEMLFGETEALGKSSHEDALERTLKAGESITGIYKISFTKIRDE